jgi:hypothetical protein
VVTNFSNLEFELIEQERQIETKAPRLSLTDSLTIGAGNLASSTPNESFNYWCIVDRNRLVRDSYCSSSGVTTPSTPPGVATKTIQQLQQQQLPPLIANNINTFYELIQSIPELSKLSIK